MNKYVVFGNPISHSKSPLIHQLFAQQINKTIDYSRRKAEVGGFNTAIEQLKSEGGVGCNVTVPFKDDAFKLANVVSQSAQLAQAANTLTFNDDGTISADNTDGVGFLLDLKTNQAPLTNKRILLIGAGGAASGVIKPLLDCDPALLTICNRTYSKAEALAKRFMSFGHINALTFEQLEDESLGFDLVINSTSASLHDELPPVPACVFNQCSFAYDMTYGNKPTVFVNWALENGVSQAIDGLGMLVGQAAKSFEIWHGIQPDITPVLAELRKTL